MGNYPGIYNKSFNLQVSFITLAARNCEQGRIQEFVRGGDYILFSFQGGLSTRWGLKTLEIDVVQSSLLSFSFSVSIVSFLLMIFVGYSIHLLFRFIVFRVINIILKGLSKNDVTEIDLL